MSAAAIIELILASIPKGAAALNAVKDLIEAWVAEADARAFLSQCTDMVRATMDAQMAQPISMPLDSLQELCIEEIRIYAMRMGHGELVEKAIAQIGPIPPGGLT